eukprot:5976137-Amphidinium_carterae.1
MALCSSLFSIMRTLSSLVRRRAAGSPSLSSEGGVGVSEPITSVCVCFIAMAVTNDRGGGSLCLNVED